MGHQVKLDYGPVAGTYSTLSSAPTVMQVRLIFQPILSGSLPSPILIYGQYFQYSGKNITQDAHGERHYVPEHGTDMFVVTRCFRSNQSRMGDVTQLQNIHCHVQLVPKFGRYADASLTKNNSMEVGTEYYINHSDKETFHAILSYQ
jgi:hypothetical protein